MKFKAHNNALFTLAQCTFALTIREKYIEKDRDLEIVSPMSAVYNATLTSKWNSHTFALESRAVDHQHRKSLFKILWVKTSFLFGWGHFTTKDLD